MREITVDLFAGGGGASEGIQQGLGISVDIAINHDPDAIAMHMANHPSTKHYTEDVFKVDPVRVVAGQAVGHPRAHRSRARHPAQRGSSRFSAR